MCKACSVFIIVCVFDFKLNSAWHTNRGLRTISIDAVPPGYPPPALIWPLPPPGEEHRYSYALVSPTTTWRTPTWQSEGIRTRSTPAPTSTSGSGFPPPAPIWPLPPPGEAFDRLIAEQMKTKTENPVGPNQPKKSMLNRGNFIPLVTFDQLPFWERHDPIPARRKSPKHKRLRKKISESTRLAPYQLVQDDPNTPAEGKKTSSIMDGAFNQYSMKDDLEKMLREINEANVTVEVLTKTVEYNDIVICKITQSKLNSRYFRAEEDKYIDEEPEKKIIFIVHGLSAMGFALVPCLNEKKSFMKLLKYYTAHLDKFDIFIVPMANPDGVGDETLLYWNKNKSPQAGCLGVALDRNFDVSWNASGSNSCNQQFPGPAPFSELESRAIGDVLHHYSHKIIAYIHVHAGTYDPNVFKGEAVLYPKGFTETTTEDDKYIDIKGEIDEAIRNAGFRVMSVSMETLYNWYGKVHGSSVDFAASIYGVPYAMEFVMQPYQDNPRANASDELVSDNVLTEIWKKVIDVVFTNIHKNTRANDVK